MKNFLLSLLLIIASSSQMYAYNPATENNEIEELYEKYDASIKRIMKETKCLVAPHRGDDGFCYFELTTLTDKKELLRGICNLEGKIIVPVNYDEIEYCPALEEGFSDDSYLSRWHGKTERSFCARVDKRNIYTIFGEDGVIKQDNIEATKSLFLKYGSGYLKFERREESRTLYGLYTSDGRQIAPIEYDKIYIEGKLCLIFQKTGLGFDEYLCGAIAIDKSLGLPDVPCKFQTVEYNKDKNALMVRNRGEGSYNIPYLANMYESSSFAEDLFYANLPNSCITYCLKQFIDGKENIHDLFFIAQSLNEKATSPYYQAMGLAGYIKKGELTDWQRQALYREYDFEVVKDVCNIVYKMYFEYILRVDEYQKQNDISQEELERITRYKIRAKTSMDILLSNLKSIDTFQEEFQPLWERFVEENTELKYRMRNWKVDEYPSVSQALFAALITEVLKPTDSIVDLCNSTKLLNQE